MSAQWGASARVGLSHPCQQSRVAQLFQAASRVGQLAGPPEVGDLPLAEEPHLLRQSLDDFRVTGRDVDYFVHEAAPVSPDSLELSIALRRFLPVTEGELLKSGRPRRSLCGGAFAVWDIREGSSVNR